MEDINLEPEKIKEKIFELVSKYYKTVHAKGKFIPHETMVHYAGRVFDDKEMINAVDSILDFYLTLGKYGKKFEEEFAKFLGVRHVVLTNSGSSANLIAMSALLSEKLDRKLKPGDEVVTVATSFPTTVNPIFLNNLVPVFLDVEIGTYAVDPSKIEEAITDKTKAIFMAHTLGIPFDINKVMEVAKKYGLYVIEDNCDALGSKYNGRYTGTFGDMGTFSFYPAHHITMGEGGAVVTNNSRLKVILESLRDWGRDCWCAPGKSNTCNKRFEWQLGQLPFGYDHKYIYSHLGYNLKPIDIQPAIGLEQLRKLPAFIEKRKENFRLIYNGLKKYEKYLILPKATENSDPCWFSFPITIKENVGVSKSSLVDFLEQHKIETRMLFAGNIVRQPAYRHCNYRVYGSLENSDFIMNNTFFIGVYPGIDKEHVNFILETFDNFFKG